MPILAVSGEYKFLRYVGQDVDAVYIKGVKAYGKNLWRFSGTTPLSTGLYGAWSEQVVSINNQSQKLIYSAKGTSGSTALKQWTGLAPSQTLDLSEKYTFSCKIKSSLPFVRFYVYIFGATNPIAAIKVAVNNTSFTDVVFESVQSTGANENASYTGVIFVGWLVSDFAGISSTDSFVGNTIEIKEIKLEQGPLSPYSINSTLL